MNLVEKIALPNDLVLQIWDKSRVIASGTTKVEMAMVLTFAVREDYFSEPEDFQKVVDVFGPEISYERTKERAFVSTSDSKRVFDELMEDFRRDLLPYILRTDFPARFAMSKLRDIRQNPYRYRDISGETGDVK
ncbi:MAG: hypothetical protein JRD69_04260 [Deltaproteobacteria bacterium]|nr:hypothetical protein [Deltaproteobacteria bacterium]